MVRVSSIPVGNSSVNPTKVWLHTGRSALVSGPELAAAIRDILLVFRSFLLLLARMADQRRRGRFRLPLFLSKDASSDIPSVRQKGTLTSGSVCATSPWTYITATSRQHARSAIFISCSGCSRFVCRFLVAGERLYNKMYYLYAPLSPM